MQFLTQERDKRIKSRIQQRIEELNTMAQDLPFVLKYRAQIELKQLKLLELQKRVRGQIVDKLRRFSEVESFSETTPFKRTSKKSHKEASKQAPTRTNITKLDTEQMRMQKHAEFISSLLKHSKDFKEYHTQRLKKVKKVAKDVVNHQANSLRKQQLMEEKQRRERLNALKENNEEEYIKLLNQTKSERLALLLKETDAYLEKIGSMISLQKDYDEIATKKKQAEDRKAKLKKKKEEKDKGKTDEKEEAKSDEKDKKDEKGEEKGEDKEGQKAEDGTEKPPGELISNAAVQERNRKYYTAAHSIQEDVKEQPKMIVGGKLKQYQLVGVQWLVSLYNNKLNGILADEMGLGK
jgi:SNF2 family DNA or RNA helicase